VISALPDDVDALFVGLGGADAVNFLSQYEQAGGDLPLVGGSITVDQSVLGAKGKTRDFVVGTPSAGPISDTWDDPRWAKFVTDYKAQFPDGFPSHYHLIRQLAKYHWMNVVMLSLIFSLLKSPKVLMVIWSTKPLRLFHKYLKPLV